MYVRVYVCVYVCMYVYMYVCMYSFIHVEPWGALGSPGEPWRAPRGRGGCRETSRAIKIEEFKHSPRHDPIWSRVWGIHYCLAMS